MDQGVSDPFIVVVKLRTDENVVTYWRRKFPVNNRKDEGEGMDMLTRKKKTQAIRNYDYEIRNPQGTQRGDTT